MSRILVYKDSGVESPQLLKAWLKAQLPHFDVQYTDAASIITKDELEQPDVRALVMPGGQSRMFKAKLEGKGDNAIQRFVEQGGAYYGFCGGAYYACKTIDFKGDEFSIYKDNSASVFFNGIAKGSLPELTDGSYYARSFNSAAVVAISYDDGKKADIYYHGGASFIGDFNASTNRILAKYAELPEGQNSAVIKCNVGNGYALLSGIHPEVGYNDFEYLLASRAPKHPPNAVELRDKLKGSHNANKNFHKYILKDLL